MHSMVRVRVLMGKIMLQDQEEQLQGDPGVIVFGQTTQSHPAAVFQILKQS